MINKIPDNAVHGAGYRRNHFQLNQQRKVIRIDVRVWTTDYLVLRDPFLRNWPEQSQRCHRRFRIENIVDNAFEFESENETKIK